MDILMLTLVAVILFLLGIVYFLLRSQINGIADKVQSNGVDFQKFDTTLRAEFQQSRDLQDRLSRDSRDELATAISRFSDTLRSDLGLQLKQFADRLEEFRKAVRSTIEDQNALQRQETERLSQALDRLSKQISLDLKSIREEVERRLTTLQLANEQKLEQMRQTVDEKLQSTLEKRLGESFLLVTNQLEAVHKGLGEMQLLATGVTDLKNVLANVKTRGTMGETQLENILEQLLTPDQYARQQAVVPGSSEKVDIAIRMPGRISEEPIWLPIDAKFPLAEYQSLVDAAQAGDKRLLDYHHDQLIKTILAFAKDIHKKYIQPPHTTDFAFLFLPIEGLYAEILREPGIMERLQREFKVIICGPTNLSAILHSLQMGFRTLQIEKRSTEVWEVLRAVKNEFGKFGDVLQKVKKKIEDANNDLDKLQTTRTKAVARKLRNVEEMTDAQAASILALPSGTSLFEEEDEEEV